MSNPYRTDYLIRVRRLNDNRCSRALLRILLQLSNDATVVVSTMRCLVPPRYRAHRKHKRSSSSVEEDRNIGTIHNAHFGTCNKKGRLAAALQSSEAATPYSGSTIAGSPEDGANIKGLVGLASGLMMSSVAPARSVCCSVRSPMCSFNPNSTRWSVTLASENE